MNEETTVPKNQTPPPPAAPPAPVMAAEDNIAAKQPADQQWGPSLPEHNVNDKNNNLPAPAAATQPHQMNQTQSQRPEPQEQPRTTQPRQQPEQSWQTPQQQAQPRQAQQVPTQNQQPQTNKNPGRFKALFPVIKKVIVVVIAVAAVYGAITFGWHTYHYEETDDAQIAGHSAVLSARVGGTVTQVLVDENWNVKQGQLLATLDQRDYQHALDQAAGDLQSIFSRQKEAEINFKRAKALIKSDSITKQEYDDDQTQYLDYTKKLASQVALVEQAKTNLAYTEIRAPTDGKIGKKSVEPGIVVAPGQSLFTFVETSERWVEANYKETQLRHMRIGQKADIDVDAVSGRTFTGHVESFSPGSGSSFALIPPDNATGNFTKIVQRVPVRIVFDKDSIAGYEDRVVPGESAVINVRIR